MVTYGSQSRRRWTVVCVVVTLLCVGSSAPAHANILGDIIGGVVGKITGIDPAKIAELVKIASAIRNVNGNLTKMRQWTADIREIQEKVYPDSLREQTAIYIEPLVTLWEEYRQLQGEWGDMYGRGRILQKRWLRGDGLTRPQLETWLGRPPDVPDADIERFYDLQAARRVQTIGDYFERSQTWSGTQERLSNLSAGASVGMAERLTAMGAAAIGTYAAQGAKLQAAQLDLANERLMRRVRARRLEQTGSIMTYMSLSGRSPLAPRPVSTDGINISLN